MTTREMLDSFTRDEGMSLLNSTKTDKEVYDQLVKKGLTDSFETYLEEAKKIANERFAQMSKEELLEQMDGVELSDDQLEAVAGGCGASEEKQEGMAIGTAIGGGVGVVAAGSGAAAVAG